MTTNISEQIGYMEKYITNRLREEIERVYGMARGAMAAASRELGLKGVQDLSDFLLGRKRITAELLAKVAGIGVDVQYVVTGVRAQSASAEKLPDHFVVEQGLVMLRPSQLAKLLGLRKQFGAGRELMWGPSLIAALDTYQPQQPPAMFMQAFQQKAKHGRSRTALALYLEANAPSAPWFLWPEGVALEATYPLDTGNHTLPILVPDVDSMPSPALELSADELEALRSGQVLEVGTQMQLRAEDEPAASTQDARMFARAFAGNRTL